MSYHCSLFKDRVAQILESGGGILAGMPQDRPLRHLSFLLLKQKETGDKKYYN